MSDTIEHGIGRRLADLFRDQMDVAVRDLAEATRDKARADAPPSPPIGEDPDPMATLRFDGRVDKVRDGVYDIVFDEPYAAKIHEAQHYDHPRGGGAKFLERNVQLAARELEGRIAAGIRSVTSRGDTGATRVASRRF